MTLLPSSEGAGHVHGGACPTILEAPCGAPGWIAPPRTSAQCSIPDAQGELAGHLTKGNAYRGEEHGVGVDGGLHQVVAINSNRYSWQEHEVAQSEQEGGQVLRTDRLGLGNVRAAPAAPTCGAERLVWISHALPCPLAPPSRRLRLLRRSNTPLDLSRSLLSLAPSATHTPVLRMVSLLIACSAVEILGELQQSCMSALRTSPRLFPRSRGHPMYSRGLPRLVLFIPTVTQCTCYLLVLHQGFKARMLQVMV